MKKITILLLFLCINSFGQNFKLQFELWKNQNTYLGKYSYLTTHNDDYGLAGTVQNSICPGDEITIKNLTVLDGVGHNFNGSSSRLFTNWGIALGKEYRCSSNGSGFYGVTKLKSGGEIAPWNHGDNITVTIPYNYNSDGNGAYLIISPAEFQSRGSGGIGATTPSCYCSFKRYAAIKINNLEKPIKLIPDLKLCSGNSVDLKLNKNYIYEGWTPNDPEEVFPTETTNYSVKISDPNSSCGNTVRHNFKIEVNNPETELINKSTICENELPFYFTPYGENMFSSKIWINDVLQFDKEFLDNANINSKGELIIDSIGIYTIKYEYFIDSDGSDICTKNYILNVIPSPVLDLGGDISVCSTDAKPVLKNSVPDDNSIYKYTWRFSSIQGVSSTPVFQTWTIDDNGSSELNVGDFGKYSLTITHREIGCTSEDEIIVKGGEKPKIDIGEPIIYYCKGETKPTLTNGFPIYTNLYHYKWKVIRPGAIGNIINFYTGASIDTNNYETSLYGETSEYTLYITNKKSGCESSQTVKVKPYRDVNISTDFSYSYNNGLPGRPLTLTANQVPINDNIFGIYWKYNKDDNNEEWKYYTRKINTPSATFYNTLLNKYLLLIHYVKANKNCKEYKRTSYITYNSSKIKRVNGIFKKEIKLDDITANELLNLAFNKSDNSIKLTDITLFPNPTSGKINLEFLEKGVNKTIEIFDMVGRKIFSKKNIKDKMLTINLSNQEKGIYLVKVISKNGKVIKQKIVLQ